MYVCMYVGMYVCRYVCMYVGMTTRMKCASATLSSANSLFVNHVTHQAISAQNSDYKCKRYLITQPYLFKLLVSWLPGRLSAYEEQSILVKTKFCAYHALFMPHE